MIANTRRAQRTVLPGPLVLLLVLFSALTFAEGPKASLPNEVLPTRVPEAVKKREEEHHKKKEQQRSESQITQFKNTTNGALILTNQPSRWRNKKGFIEVSLKYNPIKVEPRYKKLKSATQYNSSNISELVNHYSRLYGLPENLVYAVIRAESNFNPYAVSGAGARGLMQLMPATAAEMGVLDLFDPAQNIAGGTQYLAKMLDLFDNDKSLALAAYNAGPSNVADYGGIPPFAETQNYVKTVLAYAGMPFRPTYTVSSNKPKPDALPQAKQGCSIVVLLSGYTQPAEKITEEGDYYYLLYANRTALVPKSRVAKIIKAKA